MQTGCNPLPSHFTVHIHTHNQTIQVQSILFFKRVFLVIFLYLYGTYRPFYCIDVCCIMQRLVAGKNFRKFIQRIHRQAFPQLRILWHMGHTIAFQHRLDIQTGSTAQNRSLSSGYDVLIRLFKSILILKKIVFLPGICYINQMIGNRFPFHTIIGQILPCAQIHPSI